MKILFICTGNLCRSPLAEGYLKKLLKEKNLSGVEISSAGLWAIEGNTVEDAAYQVAAENGFDLSNHRSRLLKPEDIKEASIILVMEYLQMREILITYPEAKEKVRLLRSFAPDGTIKSDIDDPYGLELESYREFFKQITESIEGLFKYLKEHNKI